MENRYPAHILGIDEPLCCSGQASIPSVQAVSAAANCSVLCLRTELRPEDD